MNTLIKFSDAPCHPVSARRSTWPRGFRNTSREQLAEIGRAFARGDKRTVDQAYEELKTTSLRRLRETVSRNSPLNSWKEKKTLMSQQIFNSNICRVLFATCLSALCLIALSTQAATITVTNINDSGAGSLRQAIADAHDGDTVNLGVTGTITLTTGELLVDKSITIHGPGSGNLTIDCNGVSRGFYVSSGVTATIAGLSIANGNGQGDIPFGAGIYSDHATLAVDKCTLSGNAAGFGGGGIYNDGSNGSATLTVTNSTFSGNWAAAPYFRGVGGGIYNEAGMLTVSNCTFSENWAYSSVGGGIYNGGTVTIGNTIFKTGTWGGEGGGNIVNNGAATSNGYNLSNDNGGGVLTATGDQINTDPMLGPLQDNGGATFTHALLPGSPAIDAGKNFATGSTDQRGSGFVRMFNNASIANANGGDGTDIGAYEVQMATPTYAGQVQPPINADGTSVFNSRRGVVPVKFNLTQGGIATCDLPPATITVTRTGGGLTGEVNESVYSSNADAGSNFRIDNCQYVYNLNSRALGIGIYRVDILIDGQVIGSASFELR